MADPTYRAAQPGEFFCPAGGQWYACETGTKFVGCCIADPCTNGCHGSSLRPAGRSTALDKQSPGGSCGGQTPFWTCEQAPTFWGCCNEDPCKNNSTCPQGKLEPTYWDRPDQFEYFKDLNILLSSTAPRPTSTPSPTASVTPSSGSKVSSAVVGGAVGGTLGFVAIVATVVFLLCRRKRRNRKHANQNPSDAVDPSMVEHKPRELASPVSAATAPPTYSWGQNGGSPIPQSWAHNHPEGSNEYPKDSPRRPYSELHSTSSPTRLAELPGGTAARELDTPENTPELPQTGFGNDTSKEPQGLGVVIDQKPRNSTEKHQS